MDVEFVGSDQGVQLPIKHVNLKRSVGAAWCSVDGKELMD